MARERILNNNGEHQYREARANGTSAVTVKAPASLAGDIDFILPSALPGGTEFLTIDASGNLSTSSGASGTLDDAYDSGGAGAGRIITADAGPVEAAGAGGFLVSHSAPVYGLETTGVEYNWRMIAGDTADVMELQRGDQDADISGDTFVTVLALAGADRRVGINTVAPAVCLHIDKSSRTTAAKVRLDSAPNFDASVQFYENTLAAWEIGYDTSEDGLVVGRVDFTNPVMFFEDTTGDVGVNELSPDAKLHVTDTVQIVQVLETSNALCRLALRASGTSDANQVGIQASGDDLYLFSNGAQSVLVGASGALQAASGNWAFASDGDLTIGDDDDAADHSLTITAGSITAHSSVYAADVGSATAAEFRFSHNTSRFSWHIAGGNALMNIGAAGAAIGNQQGSGTNTLAISNGTAPTSTPVDGVVLYSEDVAASAELKVRDEAGNITILSPHSEMHGHRIEEDMGWSFYSEREGRYIWVDMLRVVRAVEHLYGYQLVHEGETA